MTNVVMVHQKALIIYISVKNLFPLLRAEMIQENYGSWLHYTYCYGNASGIFKMISKSSKNENNGVVYMINE